MDIASKQHVEILKQGFGWCLTPNMIQHYYNHSNLEPQVGISFLRSLIYVWLAELISRLRYPAYVNKRESCNSEITHTYVTFTGI